MTEEELAKVKFNMKAHLSMADEHCCTYFSEDGRLGICVHTPVKEDAFGFRDFGRSYRHYSIDGTVYKSRKKFIEALADFHPKMTMEKLKELNEK